MKSSDAEEKDMLTIIVGQDTNKKEISEFTKFVEKSYDNLDIEIIAGGQEVYSYILVLE